MSEGTSNRHDAAEPRGNRRRWAVRGIAVGVIAAPMLVLGVAQASAAEVGPIADGIDEAVASTSQAVTDAVKGALGTD